MDYRFDIILVSRYFHTYQRKQPETTTAASMHVDGYRQKYRLYRSASLYISNTSFLLKARGSKGLLLFNYHSMNEQ